MAGSCWDESTDFSTIATWGGKPDEGGLFSDAVEPGHYAKVLDKINKDFDPDAKGEKGVAWSYPATGVEWPKEGLYKSSATLGEVPINMGSAKYNMAATSDFLEIQTDAYIKIKEMPEKTADEQAAKTSAERAALTTFQNHSMGKKLKCGTGSVENQAWEDYKSWAKLLPNTDGKGNIEPVNIADPDDPDTIKTEEEWKKQQEANNRACMGMATAFKLSYTEEEKEEACTLYNQAVKALQEGERIKSERVETAMLLRKNINFKEQCFLLANIFSLSGYKKALDEDSQYGKLKKLPYESGPDSGNASLLAQGDPFAFINKLTQNAYTKKEFFNMETKEISNLQPMIRLFKIITDEKGNESQIEMQFDSNLTSTAYTANTSDLFNFKNTKETRGHGVGIKQFNFSYEADNPFAIKKSIKAKLVLHANTFDELLRERNARIIDSEGKPKIKKYAYIDLALKTGRADNAAGIRTIQQQIERVNPKEADIILENLSKLSFRLKAIVGWAMPSNRGVFMSSALKDAINDSCITLNLTPTIHEFNIDDQGRVEFVLNYLAYVEDFFDQPIYNIFSDKKTTADLLTRKLKYKTYNKNCDAGQIAEMRKGEKEQMDRETNGAMQTLVDNLLSNNKINFLTIPLEELAEFQAKGPLVFEQQDKLEGYFKQITEPFMGAGATAGAKVKDSSKDLEEDVKDESEARITGTRQDVAAAVPVDDIQTISFFYASDLIDNIMAGIEGTLEECANKSLITDIQATGITETQKKDEKAIYKRYLENFKKLRVLIGPMEIVNATPQGKVMTSRFVCMGDVPVSLRYFIEWLTKKLLKKDEAIYPLPRFLNDFFNEFLRNFLNNDTCFSNVAKQSTRLAQTAITAYKMTTAGRDEITETIISYGADATPALPEGVSPRRLYMLESHNPMPILSVAGSRNNNIINPGFEREINYLTYYAARVQPVERMNGLINDDQEIGIWHYQIGKPKGIVKTINLTKTDSPGLKEVRFEQEGYDGLQQLREMYDAKIKTYSDVSAFPGNYIYVDPAGFSPSARAQGYDLTQYGVGGYYMIIRSEHSFGAGLADTEITAKWVAEIDRNQAAEEAKDLEAEGSTDTVPAKCPGNRSTAAAESPGTNHPEGGGAIWPAGDAGTPAATSGGGSATGGEPKKETESKPTTPASPPDVSSAAGRMAAFGVGGGGRRF